MTEQHPLTITQIKKLVRRYTLDMESGEYSFGEDTVRAVADWQLDQVIEWLKVNLMKHDYHEGYAYLYDDCSNAEIEVDKVIEDLKQAMRHTVEIKGPQ